MWGYKKMHILLRQPQKTSISSVGQSLDLRTLEREQYSRGLCMELRVLEEILDHISEIVWII